MLVRTEDPGALDVRADRVAAGDDLPDAVPVEELIVSLTVGS